MKVHFDERSNALYIRLDDSRIIQSEEVKPGFVLDFDEKDQIVGIEILNVKERVPLAHLKQMQFEVA